MHNLIVAMKANERTMYLKSEIPFEEILPVKLQESIKIKKQKEEEKKLKTAEKEDKDKSDAIVLNTLKTKYLAEYHSCSPENQVKFASIQLSKVNVPDLIQIYKAFTGKGRGELNSRELLLNAIMEQFRK